MNKSVLGFLAGVVIIAIGVIGWVALNQTSDSGGAAKPATTSARPAPAPTPTTATRTLTPAPATRAQVPTATPTPAAATPTAPTELRMTRSLGGDGVYTPGGTVDLTITLDGAGADPVRALGLSENAPAGFEFDSMLGDSRPDVGPQPGATGTLEFAWITVPSFPLNFTYRLRATDGVSGEQVVRGQALYRTTGGEERTGAVESTLRPADGATAAPTAVTPAATPTPEVAMDNALPGNITAEAATPETAATTPPAAETPTPTKAASEKKEEAKSSDAVVEVTRTVSTNVYTPGEPIEVTLNMNYAGDPILALALLEEVPQGWTYGGFVSGEKPAVEPGAGPRERLTFIWITIPEFPTSLTYRLVPKDNESGPRTLNGYAVFRTNGPEVQGPPAITEFVSE